MNSSWVSVIRVIFWALTVSGLILHASAECPCKNKDYSSRLLNQSDAGISAEQKPLSDQSPGILTNGKIPGVNNFPGATKVTQATDPPLSVLSDKQNSSQILYGTLSSATRCIPAGEKTGLTSEAVPWPTPIITSLYPSSVITGNSPLTLTVDGNYFIPETRVLWDARDYTKGYLSTYQMTAEIPASELGTPGLHYVRVYNPEPCGGGSNISLFTVRDSGQSFPLSTFPLQVQVMPGRSVSASILVHNPSKGLQRYNLSLEKDPGSPFVFAFDRFPTWVTSQEVFWENENHILIAGSDENDRITSATGDVTLIYVEIYGTGTGTSSLRCTLHEAVADDGTVYGNGYTALPIISRELLPFPHQSGDPYSVPGDIDSDGLIEDINGNNRHDFQDITLFFNNTGFVISSQPWWLFDHDQNGGINVNDVVVLFHKILL
jgi:hypothetical protein